jgi:hypothetical protein
VNSGCFTALKPAAARTTTGGSSERPALFVHFGRASAEVHATHVGDDVEGFLRLFGLPIDLYFPAGGPFLWWYEGRWWAFSRSPAFQEPRITTWPSRR